MQSSVPTHINGRIQVIWTTLWHSLISLFQLLPVFCKVLFREGHRTIRQTQTPTTPARIRGLHFEVHITYQHREGGAPSPRLHPAYVSFLIIFYTTQPRLDRDDHFPGYVSPGVSPSVLLIISLGSTSPRSGPSSYRDDPRCPCSAKHHRL